MGWTEQMHPRNAKGPGGGEFKSTKGSGSASTTRTANSRTAGGGGSLSFNGKTGTGYGKKGGDPRVRKLQQALNRLHMTDANGKPLVIDGKLGPKTTAAIKAWQKRNGMKPTGAVTAADIKRMSAGGRKPVTKTTIRHRAATKGRASKTSAAPRRQAGVSQDTRQAIAQSIARQRAQ